MAVNNAYIYQNKSFLHLIAENMTQNESIVYWALFLNADH